LLGRDRPGARRQDQYENRYPHGVSHRVLLRTRLERATGESRGWFPDHNPLRSLGIFHRLGQMDRNILALASRLARYCRAAGGSGGHAGHCTHDDLASRFGYPFSAGAGRRPGSGRLAHAELPHPDR
jgi:hypothetical protein